MIFHFCKAGETLLSIAREYGISPVRLLEENALADPDRLAVGQCLVIYRSARSYTVRGGDTLNDICRRFRTTAAEVRKFNPSIGERHLLYPGQTISLGRAEAAQGCLSVNGIVSLDVSLPTLMNFASALTYITILLGSEFVRSHKSVSKCTDIVAFARQKGILPFAMISLSELEGELLEMICDYGIRGVLIAADSRAASLENAVSDARARGLAVGILGPCSDAMLSSQADWITPTANSPTECFSESCARLRRDADSDLYRLMPLLPPFAAEAADGEGAPSSLMMSECAAYAYKRNVPIERDGADCPFIRYDKAHHGKTEKRTLRFEDLASIKNGLTEIGESGMSGLTMYLEATPMAACTLLHQCFDIIRAEGERGGEHLHR